MRRPVSLVTVLWIVIGVVVAAQHGFFERADGLGGIGSAILAVIVWPLVLLGVHIGV